MRTKSGLDASTLSSGAGRPRRGWPRKDRSGQSLALVAVAAVPLLGMIALAIDVGLLLTARDEAQRAADAAALAGAGAFFDYDPAVEPDIATDTAEARAIDYATRNEIRNIGIVAAEVTPEVLLDERKVRVTVRRDAVPTFFARILGFDEVPVAAVAAAALSAGGTGQCVLPFYGADLWHEPDDDNQIPEPDDDAWEWNGSPPDTYMPVQEEGGEVVNIEGVEYNGTGWGSDLRDGVPDGNGFGTEGDWGRPVNVKVDSNGGGSGALGSVMAPGNFQLWAVPYDDCDEADPEVAQGANEIGELISGEIECSCPIELGEEYEAQTAPGQKIGQVRSGLEDRIAMDPDAYWDDVNNELVSNEGESSGRIVTIAIADPRSVVDLAGASVPVTFNNLARIFIQGWEDDDWTTKTIVGRFMGFTQGGPGPEEGNLIQYLRLVE